jgi:hypothetical protein
MTDNALKTPFALSLITAADRRADNFRQTQAKAIPVKVTKVNKDFVTVSFEPQNGIQTLPQQQIPQSFSRYGREPTQVGDLGWAVPSEYNTQTLTGLGGSYTNFYPKGNLTPLSFQPFSLTQNETRDYDQYTMTGGPKGVKIIQNSQQAKTQPPPGGQQPPAGGSPQARQRRLLGMGSRARAQWLRRAPRPALQATQSTPKAFMQIDDKGVIIHQSPDGKHQVIVDQDSNKIALNVPLSDIAYLGGDGKEGTYAPVVTIAGPSKNVQARIG